MKRVLATGFLMAAMTGAGPGLGADERTVKVYDPAEMPPSRYTVVKRLWTQDWQSMFWLPGYRDAGAAVSDITKEAASVKADGVVNLNCLKDGDYYTCYALAIKLK